MTPVFDKIPALFTQISYNAVRMELFGIRMTKAMCSIRAVMTPEGTCDMSNNNAPKIPKEVYFQCYWILKDMERLELLEAIHHYETGEGEAVFCSEDWCTMVTEDVMKEAERKLEAIRTSISIIPEGMRDGILDNILNRTGFADFAHENTWKKWKRRFVYNLARNLDLL